MFKVILILLRNHIYVIYLKTNIFVCRQLAKESNECQLGVAFIDPEKFTASMIEQNPDHVKSYISEVLKTSTGCVLAAYHTGSHYFLVVICLKWKIVWYLDSLRPVQDDGNLGQRHYTNVKAVIDRYIYELPHFQFSNLEPVTYFLQLTTSITPNAVVSSPFEPTTISQKPN